MNILRIIVLNINGGDLFVFSVLNLTLTIRFTDSLLENSTAAEVALNFEYLNTSNFTAVYNEKYGTVKRDYYDIVLKVYEYNFLNLRSI